MTGAFDRLIAEVERLVAEAGTRPKAWTATLAELAERQGLPVRVGPGAGSGLVLKSETFLELGGPATVSCALALCSEQPGVAGTARIRLLGPDIHEAEGGPLAFAQVILLRGGALQGGDYQTLVRCQHIADQIEGYMLKSTPDCLWSRVSRDAAARGLGFEVLGRAILSLVIEQVPAADSAEILFVTGDAGRIRRLGELAREAAETGREVKTQVWKARGIDLEACQAGAHCESCSDKSACDTLRQVAKHYQDRQAGPGDSLKEVECERS